MVLVDCKNFDNSVLLLAFFCFALARFNLALARRVVRYDASVAA